MGRKLLPGKTKVTMTLDKESLGMLDESFPNMTRSEAVRDMILWFHMAKKHGIMPLGLNGQGHKEEEDDLARFFHLPKNERLQAEYRLLHELTRDKAGARVVEERVFVRVAQKRLGILMSDTVLGHIKCLVEYGFVQKHGRTLIVKLKPKGQEGPSTPISSVGDEA